MASCKPSPIFDGVKTESLSQGIKDYWFNNLSPEQKNAALDHALHTLAANTKFLELGENGGNNDTYFGIMTSAARSGASNAEDLWVKHAAKAKDADPEEKLREDFERCRASEYKGITIGTLLFLAQQAGADFNKWKEQTPATPARPPVTWSAAELQVSFSNIPHRRWLYGTRLIRGEITVLAAPGGAGKTALASGIAVEIAAGNKKLGETLWGSKDQKVLYINGEDTRAEIARRLWAFCQEHNLLEQDITRLYVTAVDDARVLSMSFLRVKERATVLNEDGFNCLQAALESLRPDLVVFDSLVVFCGGGNMNDNAVMSLVMSKLKALAVQFDCAILIVHHTRKGRSLDDDPAGEAERISGAAAIVNLARRALMPVTMTEAETKLYADSVLPSERYKYFKLADVKSNLAPLSAEAPWYELASVELPNAEPPIYPNGDRVQAVKRAHLTREKATPSLGPEQLAIRFELMKLIERGLMVDDEQVPYSPNSTGNNKKRAVLARAMTAVEQATPDREWYQGDLRATVERQLEALKQEGWVVVEKIKSGRFRRCFGLRAAWERTPWARERENLRQHGGPTIRTEQEERELTRSELLDAFK
jgi:RecA-family ATPase